MKIKGLEHTPLANKTLMLRSYSISGNFDSILPECTLECYIDTNSEANDDRDARIKELEEQVEQYRKLLE